MVLPPGILNILPGGADNAMAIAREEIFGPVLTVIPYADEDDAVHLANDTDYGLAGSVFTADTDHGVAIARRIRTGTFGVNQGYAMDPPPPSAASAPAGTAASSAPKASTPTSRPSRSPSPDERKRTELGTLRNELMAQAQATW